MSKVRAQISFARMAGIWLFVLTLLMPGRALAWRPASLFEPCNGDCSVALYTGDYVETSMGEFLFEDPSLPQNWQYADDHLIATSVARRVGGFWRIALELEGGIGQRYGLQDETELWGALFFRYSGFPWDRYLVNTFAVSTGMNWASGISEVEKERAHDGVGSQWMHFFSPELTFALPKHPDQELLVRIHHRSGVYGLISDAIGGAQYLTVGLRFRF